MTNHCKIYCIALKSTIDDIIKDYYLKNDYDDPPTNYTDKLFMNKLLRNKIDDIVFKFENDFYDYLKYYARETGINTHTRLSFEQIPEHLEHIFAQNLAKIVSEHLDEVLGNIIFNNIEYNFCEKLKLDGVNILNNLIQNNDFKLANKMIVNVVIENGIKNDNEKWKRDVFKLMSQLVLAFHIMLWIYIISFG